MRIYRLVDFQGDAVKGVFYREEIQKVSKDGDRVYRIEKVLKTKGKGARKQYLVKWLGWPVKFNSWVGASSL